MVEHIKRLLLPLTVISCVFSFQQLNICYAQQQSISLGAVSISMGEEQQGVINNLKKHFDLQCVGDDGSCNSIFISDGTHPVGNIAFADGKVSYIRAYWGRGYEGTNPVPFFRTLYSLIKNYEENGYRIVDLQTAENRQPNGVSKKIFIVFKGKSGMKMIDIGYDEYQGTQTSVNIDEILESAGRK
ncbi:hypothetical protein ES702_07312 [subsurface metagenome]